MKRRLLVVCLLGCLILGWVGFTPQGLRGLLALADRLLPGSLSAQVEGALLGSWALRDVRYHGSGIRLHLTTLDWHWEPWALLSRQLLIQQAQLGEIDLWLTQTAPTDTEPPGLPALPLHIALRQWRIASLRVHRAETEPLTLSNIELQATGYGDTLDIGRLLAQVQGMEVRTQGRLSLGSGLSMDLQLRWQAPVAGLQLVGEGSLKGRYDQNLRLAQTLSGDIQGDVTGQMGDAQGRLSAELRVDPGLWLANWPGETLSLQLHAGVAAEGVSLQGDLATVVPTLEQVTGSFSLEQQGAMWSLQRLALQSSQGDLALFVEGLLDPVAATLALEGHWQALAWPLDQPTMGSSQGTLALTGNPSDYRFEMKGDWWHERLGEGQMQALGSGDALGVDLQTLHLTQPGQDTPLLEASGKLRHADGYLELQGQWTGLSWPLDAPTLSGGPGKLHISGHLPLPELP